MKVVRIVEIVLGVVFIGSSFLKAIDLHTFSVQIAAYHVITEPGLVRFTAVATTGLEMALGVAFLTGFRLRGLVWVATAAMLIGFTGLIGYAWAYHDLTDCGCFGKYIRMSPTTSIAKNLVMLGLVGLAWWRWRGVDKDTVPQRRHMKLRFAVVFAGLACAIAPMAIIGFGEPAPPPAPTAVADRPFSQFAFDTVYGPVDLGVGEHLVVLLSGTCEHCMESVAALNEMVYDDSLPPLTALMFGTEDESKEFEDMTLPDFPLQRIDPLEFIKLQGDAPPPRLYFVRDGIGVHHWNWEEDVPERDVLRTVIHGETPQE